MTEKLGYGVYRRPLAAQAYYILGDYDRALSMLESYEPDQLSTTSFDMRWGMVGRVRLLRGAVLEKLGREVDARRQYQLALEQWEDADSDLRPFVEEAQKGLARLEGRSGRFGARGKSELHRADCQVTPGRRKATDRATENRPPDAQAEGKGETVG